MDLAVAVVTVAVGDEDEDGEVRDDERRVES